MRWRGQRESENVEDVRGARFGRGAGLGCGGVLIALVIAALTGQDPAQILQQPDSDVHRIIRHFNLNASKLATEVTQALDRLRTDRGSGSGTAVAERPPGTTRT